MILFQHKYPKLLASSINPAKVSMTVKGVLAAIVPLILVLAPMFNWSVNADDFKNLTSAIEAVIVAITGAVSAGMILYGVIRKLLVALKIVKVIQ